MIFIGLCAFVGMIVCIVLLIRAIKNQAPKKKIGIGLLVCFLLFVGAAGNYSSDSTEEDTKQEASQSTTDAGGSIETDAPTATTPESDVSNESSGALTTGSYLLPCGVDLLFYDSVRNDVTGRWRYSATSSSVVTSDYALEYYNEMFSSDDELHGVWNATLGTMTCIRASAGLLFVETHEYVDGEEHDANLMFSGMLLDSKIIDIETGEEIE